MPRDFTITTFYLCLCQVCLYNQQKATSFTSCKYFQRSTIRNIFICPAVILVPFVQELAPNGFHSTSPSKLTTSPIIIILFFTSCKLCCVSSAVSSAVSSVKLSKMRTIFEQRGAGWGLGFSHFGFASFAHHLGR